MSDGLKVPEGRGYSRAAMPISRREDPAFHWGREMAHGAIKVDILLTELDRGGWGKGGAEWALPLPVLHPVTRPGEQISFADHCVLHVTPQERIEVYPSRLLQHPNEQGRSGKEQDHSPFLCSLCTNPSPFVPINRASQNP